MQRIEVKNFGPLKDITLDIKDYMVFIGPQASGKSTLAKLIYFFLKLEEIIRKLIIINILSSKLSEKETNNLDWPEIFAERIKELFEEIFPTFKNGYISFTYSDKLKIDVNIFSLSNGLENDINVSNNFYIELKKFTTQINKTFSLNSSISLIENSTIEYLLNFVQDQLINDVYSAFFNRSDITLINFIPSGRTIISSLSNSITLIENNNLDFYNEEFIKLTNTIRKFISTSNYENLFGWSARTSLERGKENIFSIADSLAFKILKGDFHLSSRGDEIIHYLEEKEFGVPLKYTSSGQQEASWLINTIHYLLVDSNNNKNILYTTTIEEPEAHLFPEAQRDITYLITLLANQPKSQVIITTHSPYILAALNNLVEAHLVGQKETKAEAVSKVINPLLWVNPENLYVGYLDKGGIEDIIDPETRLIKHEILDGVSDDIMSKFDDLLEIQYDG